MSRFPLKVNGEVWAQVSRSERLLVKLLWVRRGMPVESEAESRQVAVTLDAAKALLGFDDPGDRPAQDHRSSLPALDATRQVLESTVEILDGIGRAQAASQCRRYAQAQDC
jgi:hypothetical protein